MPRSTSSHTKPRPSSVPAFRNPQSSVTPTPPLQIEQPTLGQTLKQGFGFGAGSAIAHRIFGATPSIVSLSDKKVELPCDKERNAFETCMKTKSADDFCGNEQIAYTQCIRLSNEHD